MQILLIAISFALIYSFERAFFAFWNWPYYQNQPFNELLYSFIKGFQFDLSATSTLLLLTLPVFILKTWVKNKEKSPQLRLVLDVLLGALIFASQFPFMILSCIDNELVFITGQRFTWGALYNFKEVPGKTNSFASYYYPLVVACIIFGILMILSIAFSLRKVKYFSQATNNILAVCGLLLFVFCGLQFHPLDFAQANSSQKPILYNLTINTTYNFLHSLEENEKEHERLKSSFHYTKDQLPGALSKPTLLEGHRLSQPQNVVIFILESFNKDYNEYTPFLNELAKKGLSFEHNYANGRRSIEGVSSILAGIPSFFSTPFILTDYFNTPFQGIGNWLQAAGYNTSFFHGAHNSTMHFNELTQKIGIQNYYGLNEYPHPEHHDGAWGIPDHLYLQYMLKMLSQKKKPFFASVFTLSSHHPFKVPEEFKNKFKKGPLDILESIQYTDESIRLFFEAAKKEAWYNNTLFVFVADHTYKPISPFRQNLISTYEVPLIFYHPKFHWPKDIDRNQITSHIDIVPSVMDFVGVKSKTPRLCLGKSVFAQGPRSAINYLDRKDLLITSDYRVTQFLFGSLDVFSTEDNWLQKPIENEKIVESAKEDLLLHRKYLKDYFENYSQQSLCPEF